MKHPFLFLTLLILPIVIAGCQEQAQPEMPPLKVTAIQPAIEEVTDYDRFIGRLEEVESVEIRARVSGYLQQIRFEDGQLVKKGEVLFQIDPRPFESAVKIAQGNLEQAKAQSELAKAEYDRSKGLIKTGAISQEEVDRRRQDSVARQAAVMTAEGQLQQAELDLEFCQVTAPIDGRISESYVDEGNYVEGGTTNASLLTRIVTDNPIYAYWDADESSVLKYTRLVLSGDLPTVRDKKIPVELALADEDGWPHQGYMDFAENRLDRATATIRVRAIFDNPDGLMTPGMFARINVRASAPYQAMMVPDAAIGTDQNQRFVYVLKDDNTVAYRKVELGPRYGSDRAIRSGLKPGDWVVIDNLQMLRDGAQVVAEKQPAGGKKQTREVAAQAE